MDNVIAQNFYINDQLKALSSYASCVKRKPASVATGNQTLEGGLQSRQGDATPSTHPPTAKPINGEHSLKELSSHTDLLGQAQDILNLAELKELHNNTQQDDNDDFHYPSHVIRKKRQEAAQKTKFVVGHSKSGDVRGAPEPSRDIFVYRVHKDTTNQEMKDSVVSQGIAVSNVECSSKCESSFNSFKVTLPVSHLDRAFDPGVWPKGARMHRFWPKWSHIEKHLDTLNIGGSTNG